jgi:L-2-hydroxyglutarate oxidase LhgO
MEYRADITIVGAGVVGLAIAAEVADGNRRVYVLEKNDSFGRETSSRHSGVIHSGIYYPPGTLKARLCVAGNDMLYKLCSEHNTGCAKLGKLIVATSNEEVGELEELFGRGQRNGAAGLRLVSKRQLQQLEPNVVGEAAIWAAETGIIDSHALMKFFIARLTSKSAQIAYRTEVVGINKVASGYRVSVRDGEEEFSFITSVLINCAGLGSDRVAEMAGIDIASAGYRLHYCKGEYFSVGGGKNRLVSRLIFPAPPADVSGVGIHVTLDLDGRMRLGPSIQYIDSLDYSVRGGNRGLFYRSVKPFLPFIEHDDLAPEMAGIRPKLQGPGEDIRDFVIAEESDKGLPGFINLIGIESPGLTAAPAIAGYVAGIIRGLV